jgi:hypothetical protein
MLYSNAEKIEFVYIVAFEEWGPIWKHIRVSKKHSGEVEICLPMRYAADEDDLDNPIPVAYSIEKATLFAEAMQITINVAKDLESGNHVVTTSEAQKA